MEKKELINQISRILVPLGFKRKGNYWVVNGDILTKMVNLQMSQYANSFFINYGYIIRSIPLNNLTMHVFKRLGSLNKDESLEINDLLNLDNNILNNIRIAKLEEIILSRIISEMASINTENDLLNELRKRSHLNDIPLIVKNHFDLIEK